MLSQEDKGKQETRERVGEGGEDAGSEGAVEERREGVEEERREEMAGEQEREEEDSNTSQSVVKPDSRHKLASFAFKSH